MMRPFVIFFALTLLNFGVLEAWELTGTVESVIPGENQLLVSHQGIKDYAEKPGSLKVTVSPGDIAATKVGRTVRGQLSQGADGLVLQKIWAADEKVEQAMTLINRDMMRPRIGQTSKRLLAVGDELPRFALYNQLGNLITPDDLKNKLVVLNFVFTRSSVPSMSPAITQRMGELQKRLIEGGHKDSVLLLSISLDPDYDTPGICYTFLEKWKVDHSSFWMLTGSAKVLDYLRKQIGVVATPSEKTIINHSMVTLISDREGKVFYRKPGSRWEVDELYGRLEILLQQR